MFEKLVGVLKGKNKNVVKNEFKAMNTFDLSFFFCKLFDLKETK